MPIWELENLSDSPSDLIGLDVDADDMFDYSSEILTPMEELLCLD